MSAEHNVEVMQKFVGAVFAGENDKLPQYLHPDFELIHSRTVPYTGVYKGAQGFLDFLGIFMGTFDPLDMKTGETFVSPEGSVIAEILLAGTLKSTGQKVETSMLEKWEFEEGLVRRIKPHYFDPNPVD